MAREVVKPTLKVSYQVMRAIENNGRMINGFYCYSDGWSDQRIADEHSVDLAVVKYRRKELFGELSRNTDQPDTKIRAEFDNIREEFAKLKALIVQQQKIIQNEFLNDYPRPKRPKKNGKIEHPSFL